MCRSVVLYSPGGLVVGDRSSPLKVTSALMMSVCIWLPASPVPMPMAPGWLAPVRGWVSVTVPVKLAMKNVLSLPGGVVSTPAAGSGGVYCVAVQLAGVSKAAGLVGLVIKLTAACAEEFNTSAPQAMN